MFLGTGYGGVISGVVPHQLLQTHAILSGAVPMNSLANMKTNMFADGIFQLAKWTVELIGVAMLPCPSDYRLSDLTLVGAILAGWSGFNLVGGLINQRLLGMNDIFERAGVSL